MSYEGFKLEEKRYNKLQSIIKNLITHKDITILNQSSLYSYKELSSFLSDKNKKCYLLKLCYRSILHKNYSLFELLADELGVPKLNSLEERITYCVYML